jgi:hypothetical protein
MPHEKSKKEKTTFREDTERWLRKVLFPKRDHQYSGKGDTTLKQMVVEYNVANPNRSAAELELETRAWLRDFWTRSVVTWLALAISILALSLSYCSFKTSKENREQLQKGDDPYQELLREYLKKSLKQR